MAGHKNGAMQWCGSYVHPTPQRGNKKFGQLTMVVERNVNITRKSINFSYKSIVKLSFIIVFYSLFQVIEMNLSVQSWKSLALCKISWFNALLTSNR